MYCTGLKTTNNDPPKSSRPCAVSRPIFVSFRVTYTTTTISKTRAKARGTRNKDLEHFNKPPTTIHHSSPHSFTSGLVSRSLTPHLTSSLQRTEAPRCLEPRNDRFQRIIYPGYFEQIAPRNPHRKARTSHAPVSKYAHPMYPICSTAWLPRTTPSPSYECVPCTALLPYLTARRQVAPSVLRGSRIRSLSLVSSSGSQFFRVLMSRHFSLDYSSWSSPIYVKHHSSRNGKLPWLVVA